MIGSRRSLAGESGPRGAIPALLLALSLAGMPAGCSLVGGENKLPQGQAAYPNLGTVPTKAPPASSSAERQQVSAGLVADRENAAYSSQTLTAQPAAAGGVAPPAPLTITPSAQAAPQAQPQPEAQPQPAPQATASSVQPVPASGATPMAAPPNPAPAPETPPPADQAAAPQPSAAAGGSYANNGAPIILDADTAAAPQGQGAISGSGRPVALIYFLESSTNLSERDLTVLHDVYLIQRQQGGRIRLVGHASQSSTSSDPAEQTQLNDRLSLARANAVARALLDMGTPRSALDVAAAGSANPAYAETTPAGEAGNRRVDIFLDR